MMKRRRPLRSVAIAWALFASGLAGSAVAQEADKRPLDLCNQSSFAADVAIGLEVSTGAATQGWFRVLPGACRQVLNEGLGAQRHLLHVRPLALYGTPPDKEPGVTRLCVRDTDFLIAGANECAREGQFMADFVAVEPVIIGERRQVAIDEAAGFDLGTARIAGLQRLLGLAGYDAGTIDGLRGARTAAAITTFASDAGLEKDNLSGIMTNLVGRIEKGQVDSVPQFCNETLNRIMFSIGLPTGKRVETRGWFEVAPGNCARPLSSTLSGQKLYVFAEAVDNAGAGILSKGRPVMWTGETTLCTKNLEFSIRDHDACEARGLTARGFMEFTVPEGRDLIIPFQDLQND